MRSTQFKLTQLKRLKKSPNEGERGGELRYLIDSSLFCQHVASTQAIGVLINLSTLTRCVDSMACSKAQLAQVELARLTTDPQHAFHSTHDASEQTRTCTDTAVARNWLLVSMKVSVTPGNQAPPKLPRQLSQGLRPRRQLQGVNCKASMQSRQRAYDTVATDTHIPHTLNSSHQLATPIADPTNATLQFNCISSYSY